MSHDELFAIEWEIKTSGTPLALQRLGTGVVPKLDFLKFGEAC